MAEKDKGTRASVQELTGRSIPPLSNSKHLLLHLRGLGDHASFALPDSFKPGFYTVILSTVTSWDYGTVPWSLDGQALGPPIDGYSSDTWRRVTAARQMSLADRPHELEVKLVGRHRDSSGFSSSLDAILLRRSGDR